MERQNRLLILWIIFGFVIISAIVAGLYILNWSIFYLSISLYGPYSVLKYALPAFAFISYGLTAYLILRNIETNSDYDGIYLKEFPKRTFIAAALVSIVLLPAFHKLSGLLSEKTMDLIDNIEFLSLYGSTSAAMAAAKWIILIVLSIVFLRKLNN